MKKTLLILWIVLMTTTGCKDLGYENYMDALHKTENLAQLEEDVTVKVNMEYDLQSLSEEAQEIIRRYQNYEMKIHSRTDRTADMFYGEIYFSLGKLGFDSKAYGLPEGLFLEIPFFEKALSLQEEDIPSFEADALDLGEIGKLVSEAWKRVIQEEDVFTGDQVVLETRDGKIKVTEYTLTINNEDFQELIADVLPRILTEERKRAAQELINGQVNWTEMEEFIKGTQLTSFDYKVYVDFDGYILSEALDFSLSFEDPYAKSMQFQLATKVSNVNKEMNFSFPTFTPEEVMTLQDLEENFPIDQLQGIE